MTRTITQRQRGVIIAVLCTICLIGGFALATAPVHAAGGTINVTYSSAQGNFDTTFKVYKVGHFENGNDLVWDDTLGTVASQLPNVSESQFDQYGDQKTEEWRKALESAGYVLKNALEAPTDPLTIEGYPLTCAISKSTGTGSVSVTENGLYLIYGPQETVQNGGIITHYTPIPGFVTVFSGRTNPEVAIKAVTSQEKQYQVVKEWVYDDADEDREKLLRPDGIRVRIYYRDDPDDEWTEATFLNDGKPIILKDDPDNPWSFKWNWNTTESPTREWTAQEDPLPADAAPYYVVSPPEEDPIPSGYVKRFILKNTFKQYSLELTKVMDEFVKHNDHVATTITFEIKGYVGDEVTYSTRTSIGFTGPGEKYTTVPNIPVNLDKIVVTEIYTANYTPSDPNPDADGVASVTLYKKDLEDGVYKAKFKNDWSETVNYDGGVINQFKLEDDGQYHYNIEKLFESPN